MKWPWRRHHNGEAVQAGRDADEQLKAAHERTPKVDATTKVAKDLARRSDRFAREFQRSMHQQRGSA
jgi:hypothetical protein